MRALFSKNKKRYGRIYIHRCSYRSCPTKIYCLRAACQGHATAKPCVAQLRVSFFPSKIGIKEEIKVFLLKKWSKKTKEENCISSLTVKATPAQESHRWMREQRCNEHMCATRGQCTGMDYGHDTCCLVVVMYRFKTIESKGRQGGRGSSAGI